MTRSRATRLAAGGLLAAVAPAAHAGIGLPFDASLDGHRIDSLLHTTILLTGFLFVVMVVWMFIPIFRRRTAAAYEPGGGPRTAAGVVGLALGVFAVVDGNLLTHALIDVNEHFWNFEGAEKTPGALRVEVNARQWAWDFRHPGPDGQFNTEDDIVALNELRVPVGSPVILQLGASDVVHSIYLPNFRVKQDAVPGSITRLWFQAQKPGEYEIGCAQHCGPNHYKMRGKLVAMERREWEAWASTAAADARRAYDPEDSSARWGWEWRKL